MRVDGPDHVFDFTYVSDVADGLATLIGKTAIGHRLPPIHFVGGRGTSLRELAAIAQKHGRAESWIEVGEERAYDVPHFVGDPARAHELLGWRATTSVEDGVSVLIDRIWQRHADAANGQ